MRKYNKDDLGGYLVPGSNSEAACLSYEELLKLIKLTVETARKDRTVLAVMGLANW